MDNLAAVNGFLQDIGCLEPVTKALGRVNITPAIKSQHRN